MTPQHDPPDCRCRDRSGPLPRERRERRAPRERPPGRGSYIRSHRLRPLLDEQGRWDGATALDANGRERRLSPALWMEMERMIEEGQLETGPEALLRQRLLLAEREALGLGSEGE